MKDKDPGLKLVLHQRAQRLRMIIMIKLMRTYRAQFEMYDNRQLRNVPEMPKNCCADFE